MLPAGRPEDVGMDPAALRRAFNLLRKWVDDGTVPGAAALVARRGVVVGRCSFGATARVQGSPPIKQDTLFAVASVTKPFTATAVMQLAEDGVLSIDQRVRDLLPEFDGPGKERITLRHFLTHTSGLPEYADDNDEIRSRHQGLDAFVRSYCRGRPVFPPGSQWSYSNYGFGLAGEIISRAVNEVFRVQNSDEKSGSLNSEL